GEMRWQATAPVGGTQTTPAKIVKNALALVRDYLLPHAQAAFGMMCSDQKTNDARKVWRWIIQNGEPRFQKRGAYQGLKGTFKKVEDLEQVLHLLERHHLIRQEPTHKAGPGRKPSPFYEVNPNTEMDSHNSQNQASRVPG